MNPRKQLKKSVILFLIITFVITRIPMFFFIGTGCQYDMNNPPTALLTTYAMLCPTIGVLCTRWIMKEGFAPVGKDSLLLGISFQKKKWIWYVMAFVFPLLYWLISDVVFFVLQPQCFDTQIAVTLGLPGASVLVVPFMGMVTAVTISFGALGEEIGWRTYLYPRLEELFGLKGAILIGGAIWGIWHWPLVAVGHIGTGYWGEPYTGFLVFTIECIFTGCVLYCVMKKSGSVWPAVFLHAFHNTGADPLGIFLNMEKANGIFKDSTVRLGVLLVGVMVMGSIAYQMLRKDNDRKGLRYFRL